MKNYLWLKNETDLSRNKLSRTKYAILKHPYYSHLYDHNNILIYDVTVVIWNKNSETSHL